MLKAPPPYSCATVLTAKSFGVISVGSSLSLSACLTSTALLKHPEASMNIKQNTRSHFGMNKASKYLIKHNYSSASPIRLK